MLKDVSILDARIDQQFLRKYKHQYRIRVVYDPYDTTINFFIDIQFPPHRPKSVPLHSIRGDDQEYFEQVIDGVRAYTNLTMTFWGFGGTGWRWQRSGQLIEKKSRSVETDAGLPF